MTLRSKLIKLKEGAIAPARSRATRRKEWIAAIEGLYEKIEGFLKPLISARLITVEREPIERYEEKYGPYRTERLVLMLPGEQAKIVFEPVARDGIGHRGRVDVFRYGFYTEGLWLLRMGADGDDPNWRFVDKVPGAKGHSLSRSNLESVIDRLIGG